MRQEIEVIAANAAVVPRDTVLEAVLAELPEVCVVRFSAKSPSKSIHFHPNPWLKHAEML